MNTFVVRYLLLFFLAVFTLNAVGTLVKKVNDAKALVLQAGEDTADEEDGKAGNGKKFQYNPNNPPFDDDICHDFHFSNYFVTIQPVRYSSPVPPLLEARTRIPDCPPEI